VKASTKTLALALVIGAPLAASAESLALLPPTGVNVDAGTLAAAQDVLRGQLEMTRRYAVKEVPPTGTAPDPSPEVAARIGREAGADLAVALRLTQLGATLRARLVAWRVEDGRQVHFDELPAASTSELDSVLERLALGLATGRPASAIPPRAATARTAPEPATPQSYPPPPPSRAPPPAYAPPPPAYPPQAAYAPPPPAYPGRGQGGGPPARKEQAASSSGVRIGGAWRQDLPPPRGDRGGTSIAIFTLFDIQDLLADVSLEYVGGSGNTIDLGLGIYWPILPGDATPYVGGGLKYTWLDYGIGWRNGFTPFAAVGILAGRHWSVQPRVELDFFYDAFLSQAADGTGHNVNGIALSVGLGF
jgi:hypothetical protein